MEGKMRNQRMHLDQETNKILSMTMTFSALKRIICDRRVIFMLYQRRKSRKTKMMIFSTTIWRNLVRLRRTPLLRNCNDQRTPSTVVSNYL